MHQISAHIEVRLSQVIAGLLNVPAQAVPVPLPAGQGCSLRDVLRHLEAQAPGALLEPRSGQLRRHIHVYVSGRPVADLAHPVGADDVVQIDLRMLEGGERACRPTTHPPPRPGACRERDVDVAW